MTDNLQLQTSRLTNASDGNLIDDALADIENCVRVLWGITADTPISQVMSITAAGNVTMIGDLTLSAAPTSDLHCATKKYVDDNAAGGGAEYRCKIVAWSNTYVAASGSEFVVFGGADVEEGSSDQWDVADPTKLVCKSAGDYLVMGEGAFRPYDPAPVSAYFTPYEVIFNLVKDGTDVMASVVGQYNDNTVVYSTTRTFGVILTLAENEYLQLECSNFNDDNGYAAGGLSGGVPAGCTLSFVKLG